MAMAPPCDQLGQLRKDASKAYNELEQRKKRAREKGLSDEGRRRVGHTDYEGLLRRQIDRLSRQIEQHIAKHNCQE